MEWERQKSKVWAAPCLLSSLGFPRWEPEVFLHERWVHSGAIRETSYSFTQKEDISKISFVLVYQCHRKLLSLSLTLKHTHNGPNFHTPRHPSITPGATAGMYHCWSPDAEPCSRPFWLLQPLSAGRGHKKGRRQWSVLINNTSTALTLMNKS